ncbi:MAG: acetylxylan esterase [Bryobacterales bacterium]|nr:acetylxylan esterase [Bryobacterales bacterium]
MSNDEIRVSRRSGLKRMGVAGAAAFFGGATPSFPADQRGPDEYPPEVTGYLKRLFEPGQQRFAFRPDYPGGFQAWQRDARAALRLRLGMDRIAAAAGKHRPVVETGEPADMGEYTLQQCAIMSAPEVRLPFWLLKPKGKGPWPLGIFPHGHSATGHNTTAGVFTSERSKQWALSEDRDVAVQAAKAGMVAIAPAVRGISWIVPDLRKRVGTSCRSHAMQCVMAGHTAMGERVWDMERLLDWAIAQPDVDSRHILSMGNSGGGMVTIFLAASDQRITVAVPSCSFAPSVSPAGYILHCPCNTVPGIMDLGGLPNVAGLTAPRYFLAVNGRKDKLYNPEEIEAAAAAAKAIYRASGHAERCDHRWGSEGHRFYKDLMWPFIKESFALPSKA